MPLSTSLLKPTRIAAVTGANKGIGLAIVRQLALRYPSSPLNNGPLLIYLTARDRTRGEEAVRKLETEEGGGFVKKADGAHDLVSVQFHELDIAERESVRKFADFLRREHPEGIDIVVNNAGVAMTGFDTTVVTETLRCNYYGTLDATRQFLPLIRNDHNGEGRLVNVSSMSGHLNSKYSPAVRERFLNTQTVADITTLMEEFADAVKKGDYREKGWPGAAYAVSKSGITGMTRAIALEQQRNGSKTLINSCCPGYVATDMTRGGGVKTPDEGAQTPVLLALGDIQKRSGLFWQDERPVEW